MNFKELKKYLGLFILAVAVIAVYKTFDNFNGIIAFFKRLCGLLTPFFIAFAIAYLLYPLCRRLEARLGRSKRGFIRRGRRGMAVAVVYAGIIAVLAGIIAFIVPLAMRSISDFIAYSPALIKNIITFLRETDFYGFKFDSLLGSITPEKILSKFEVSSIGKYAEGVMGISSSFFNVFMGIIISVYVLLDRSNLKSAFMRVASLAVKPSARGFIRKYALSINTFVYRYIVCQFTDALIVFALSLVVFAAMRIKYATVFAAMLGLCNLIPYFGAIISGVVSTVVTLFVMGPAKACMIAVAILVLQQVDGNIINPALVKDHLNVKPFWVILGILVGGSFFGVLGIFFASPVMALLNVMLNDFLTLKEAQKAARSNDADGGADAENNSGSNGTDGEK